MRKRKDKKIRKNQDKNTDKWFRNLRFLAAFGISFLVLAGYFGYILIYRTRTEPKTAANKTSADPALYTIEEQMAAVRSFEEFYGLAFQGETMEEEYGTIPIPGLKATRTLSSNQGGSIQMCTSMTPQGLAVAEDYLLISAYCHTHEHNSVVYVLDKNTHEFVKEIVLMNKDHVGGLAYDVKYQMIWVSTSHEGRAAASAFSLEDLKAYDLDQIQKPIAYTHDYELYMLEKDSFMTYADGSLYIGHFSEDDTSVLHKYEIGDNGGLKTRFTNNPGMNGEIAVPEEIKEIPKRVQGFAIYEGKAVLTQSYGIQTSSLLVYDYDDTMSSTQKKYTINKITLPQKLQQIYIDGTDLYVLFESAAYAYSAQPLPKVDRIIKLKLSDVLKVDIEDLVSEKDAIEAPYVKKEL